jgi:peptidoglycan/xylan/chitin deacetylase (PgdA/CDA1 family)
VSKIINIIASVLTLLIIAGWYFINISLYYLFPVLTTYIAVVTFGTLNISFNYFFHSYCNSSTSKKEIALTFDDGPHPDITPQLIKLLDLHNIPATFFCTGKNALAYPEIISSMHQNNHLIGNHSYGHSVFFDLFLSTRMQKEIVDTNEVLEKITGKIPLLFRPPYGITNPLLRKAIKKTNMTSVGWSLRPFDSTMNTKYVISKLKSNTSAGDIVLFHDTNPDIISILEDYIIWLQKNDFKIVSLTNLLNISAYED